MAKAFGGKRPQNLRHTLRRFGDYLGHHKRKLALIGVLTSISALAALIGTYMIRPAVNGILENGSLAYLAGVVAFTAFVYLIGALSTLGYTQLMVRTAQRITQEIRSDLFAHLQTMPLNFFDTNRKGDLMSLFTNDVDTISDALNNSFAVVIQMFIQIAGTLFLLFVLNWRLSLLVVVGYIAMFWYINYSTRRSRAYYASQQASLGELDAYMEEMIAGQKVVKVFNHQQADMAAFAARNEKLRQAGTGAQSYAATMIPAVVSIGYINYAIISVVGGLMDMWGWSDLGSLASYLVFVRQTTLPINQFTQQGNFLLAALAGAERIFTVMEERPEIDEGTVELVRVRENADGTLTECAEKTGRWAWCDRSRPDVPPESLTGDVRFHNAVHLRQLVQNVLLVPLGHAAGDQDLLYLAGPLQLRHLQNVVDGLLAGGLQEAAGVHHHHVGPLRLRLDGVAGGLDRGHHLLAVHLILGAAQGDKGNVVWHDRVLQSMDCCKMGPAGPACVSHWTGNDSHDVAGQIRPLVGAGTP